MFVSSASADAGSARIALQPGAQFPHRQFVVTLPAGAHPYDVHVSENGVPVIPHLVSLNTKAVPVSLVVLLDTSNSMRGKPLTAALDAAQTLIDQKSSRSEVAVYGFSEHPYVIHQWATDRSAFQASLTSVSVTHGTALWDAVTYASQELRGRTGSSKAIVVLTDGADISSTATAASATAVARSVGAHVYAVGLPGVRSEATDVQSMVDGTGGDFIRVSSLADLKSVYAGLATRLKQQYQLSYESQLRGVGKQVTVRLDVDGVSAEQHYTIPANCDRAWPPRRRPGGPVNGALVGIALAVGLVILVSAYLALRPVPVSARRRLRRYGQKSAADKVSLPDALPQRPRPGAANGNRWWARFVADVDRGEIDLTPMRVLVAGMVGGAVVLGVVGTRHRIPADRAGGPPAGDRGRVGLRRPTRRRLAQDLRRCTCRLAAGAGIVAASGPLAAAGGRPRGGGGGREERPRVERGRETHPPRRFGGGCAGRDGGAGREPRSAVDRAGGSRAAPGGRQHGRDVRHRRRHGAPAAAPPRGLAHADRTGPHDPLDPHVRAAGDRS